VFEHCDKNIVFDGELYARNEPVTTISGACRNDKNPVNKKLQYHCFDLAIPDVDQHNRLALRDKILSAFAYKQKSPFEHNNGTLDYPVIVNVLSVKIQSDAESTLFRDDCIDAGYEGCVTRNGLAEYKFGSRPKTIMKWKKAKYGSFEVIDIIKFGFDNTDNNNHVGKGVLFVLKNDINPLTFESRPIGDLDQQMEMIAYKSKIIGTKVTVRYFERTEDGKPFHTNVIDVK
jgi:ATP-dependent DNA ligase